MTKEEKDFFNRMDKEWHDKQVRISNLINLIELNGHDHELVLQAFVDDLRKNDPDFIENDDEQENSIIIDNPF